MSDEKGETAGSEPRPTRRRAMFTDAQKQIMLKYYNEGMMSTNRQHIDTIEKCAKECQTSVDRIKRFIGAENYKRKKKAQNDDGEESKPRKRRTQSKAKTKQKKGKETDEENEDEDDDDDEN